MLKIGDHIHIRNAAGGFGDAVYIVKALRRGVVETDFSMVLDRRNVRKVRRRK